MHSLLPEILRISFLGGISVHDHEGNDRTPSPYKCRLLLAYLCVPNGVKHTRMHLADVFWPDKASAQALKSLRTAFSVLRRSIGSETLKEIRGEISIDLTSLSTDTGQLSVAASDGTTIPQHPVCMKEFLAGYVHDQDSFRLWLDRQRDLHRALCIEHAMQQHQLLCHASQYNASISILQQALSLEPYSEIVHRALIQVYFDTGERGLALAQYRSCRDILRNELDVAPSAETTTLADSIASSMDREVNHAASLPERKFLNDISQTLPASVSPNNLPFQNTPYIGKLETIDRLAKEVMARRLITLTGIGGIGKTALAQQAGSMVLPFYPGGVWFVRLAPVSTPLEMLSSIVSALSIDIVPGTQILDSIVAQIDHLRLILILDNFEHLMTARDNVRYLLENTQNLSILVTSRHRLNLQAEAVFPVTGLSHSSSTEYREDLHDEASELFIDAAKRTRLDFKPSESDILQISQIGSLVDGHPLALGIAASWVDSLSCQNIVLELKRGLSILETESPDVPERHRSIRATFNYSWTLLDEKDQLLFASLSVFRGGFDRAAAKSVAGASLSRLTQLVRKSLVAFPLGGRYELHELMRQFAEEKLRSLPEHTEISKFHCQYYLGLLDQISDSEKQESGENSKTRFNADYENFRKAWHFRLPHRSERELISSISALRVQCSVGAHSYELLELIEPLLPLIDNPCEEQEQRELVLNLLLAKGFAFRYTKGYFAPELNEIFSRAYALTSELDTSAELFVALYGRWSFNFTRGLLAENLDIIRRWKDRLASFDPQKPMPAYARDAQFVVNMLEGPQLQSMGELTRGRQILHGGLKLEEPRRYSAILGNYGLNFAVSGRHWLAINQCAAGLIDQSESTMSAAREIAAQQQNPYLILFVAFGELTIATLLNDGDRIEQQASAVISLVNEHQIFIAFQHHALIHHAYSTASNNDSAKLSELKKLVTSDKGMPLFQIFDSLLLADSLVRNHLEREAISCIDVAMVVMKQKSLLFNSSECSRIRADALASLGNYSEAEYYYESALKIAREQQAGLFELRAAHRYAVLLFECLERPTDARDVLLPVLNRYTEGHESYDYVTAQGVIESM